MTKDDVTNYDDFNSGDLSLWDNDTDDDLYTITVENETRTKYPFSLDSVFKTNISLVKAYGASDTSDIKTNSDSELILWSENKSLLDKMLKDHSTGHNILWATDNYVNRNGGSYAENKEIHPDLILGENIDVIIPRAKKDKLIQKERTQKSAEVFTPSWIVDKQVMAVLEEFKDYKLDQFLETTWMEITCGEAPYMTNRYDMMSGEPIGLDDRKGFIDRKFQRLNDDITVDSHRKWVNRAVKIYESSYGFEFQGDSLILARMNLLYTFIENHVERFNEKPSMYMIEKIIDIITWNIFQMDGLKYTVPYAIIENYNEEDGVDRIELDVFAKLKDWKKGEVLYVYEMIGKE